jgi:hypothetical protein
MNDNDLSRARANADFLIPNIREYHTGGTINNETTDDASYYFGTEWTGYPINAVSTNSNYGILYSELGEYYPRDYFYRFNYNKVYTVSSFHNNYQVDGNFANINELHPAEEEDCGDKLTPPSNFGFRNYTFTLLIADFLLILDYVIKLIVLTTLNILVKDVLNPLAEGLINFWGTEGTGRNLRRWTSNMQIDNTTKLSLINYPECTECAQDVNIVAEEGCDLYDTIYNDNIITGVWVDNGMGGRTYKPTAQAGDKVVATLLSGNNSTVHVPFPPYSSGNDIRDIESEVWSRQPLPASHRSEFMNGIFYIVPGTHSISRLGKIISEYYRRKRVGKMFCGGIVNYAFIDNWLSGSLYFTQFKVKRIITAINKNSEYVAKYCRNIARLVVGQKRLYYRSAPTLDGLTFTPDNLNKPTTFVDLGPRDEFIKEICTDPNLDPNCSISRSIGATSYQDLGELLGLAINYRMDVADANGNLNMFFQNNGFSTGVGISNVLDGDILQLLSINNETGIQQFDLQDPRYLGYQFNILDPEDYPQVFKNYNANYGPLPVTLELSDEGQRIRSCLNEATHYDYNGKLVQGRLTESSQKVPFYLWNKKGTGFGSYNGDQNNQSWDYTAVQTKPLQGMTYGYNLTGGTNDSSDQYILLPMTYTFSGLTLSGVTQMTVATTEFDVVSPTDGHTNYNTQYPGFTYLYAPGWNGITEPTSGTLYTRYGNAGTDGIVGWSKTTGWTNTTFVIKQTQDYYTGNYQILSTPFQFYFGLLNGKTGLDKFVDYFGPKNAFVELSVGSQKNEFDLTPTPTPTSTLGVTTPTPTQTPAASSVPGTTPTPTQTPAASSVPGSTPTTTPTLTPTPTSVFTTVIGFSGNTLNSACSGVTPSTIYYTGSIVTGVTQFYDSVSFTNQVSNGYYTNTNTGQVYQVTGSEGRLYLITSCPPLTPTPTPTQQQTPLGDAFTIYGASTSGDSCNNISGVSQTIYAAANDDFQGSFLNTHTYYTSNGFKFDGTGRTYWSDGVLVGTINVNGIFTRVGFCL